jgi:hypothetical protein
VNKLELNKEKTKYTVIYHDPCEGKSKITMMEKKWFCEDWKLIEKLWEKERIVKVKMFCLLSFNIH